MEKVEIEEWDKEKVQKETNMDTLKLHGAYLGFIEEKLGKEAVIECISAMAKLEAGALQNIPTKEDGALKLAVLQGTALKNFCGSEDVEVEGDEEQAIVTIGKCMALENTRELINMGAPITEEMIKEAVEKTEEDVDFALLDWKGMGKAEQRDEILKILDKLYIRYKRTSEVNKEY